ncbi:response regulator [bacterium]|nr:MAG: response regulator [bacterium]
MVIKKRIILILEQEFNLANGLKAILEKEGYGVLTDFSLFHPNGLGDVSKPDLIIININVPKKFGLNILRKAKDNFPGIPLIAMSVYSHSFSKSEISRLGVDDFITKPFEIVHLKKLIEELMVLKA